MLYSLRRVERQNFAWLFCDEVGPITSVAILKCKYVCFSNLHGHSTILLNISHVLNC